MSRQTRFDWTDHLRLLGPLNSTLKNSNILKVFVPVPDNIRTVFLSLVVHNQITIDRITMKVGSPGPRETTCRRYWGLTVVPLRPRLRSDPTFYNSDDPPRGLPLRTLGPLST